MKTKRTLVISLTGFDVRSYFLQEREPFDRALFAICQIPDETLVDPLLTVIKEGIHSPLFNERYNDVYYNKDLYLILKADWKYHFLNKKDNAIIKQKIW